MITSLFLSVCLVRLGERLKTQSQSEASTPASKLDLYFEKFYMQKSASQVQGQQGC